MRGLAMAWGAHQIKVDADGVGECAVCGPIQAIPAYKANARLPWQCPTPVRANWRRQNARRSLGAKELRLSFIPANGIQCAICAKPLTVETAEVDHDHEICGHRQAMKPYCDKCVRGILCGSCNTAIGKLRDNPDLMRRA